MKIQIESKVFIINVRTATNIPATPNILPQLVLLLKNDKERENKIITHGKTKMIKVPINPNPSTSVNWLARELITPNKHHVASKILIRIFTIVFGDTLNLFIYHFVY
jgi:hypothetical protein